jgi:hypothetical protein
MLFRFNFDPLPAKRDQAPEVQDCLLGMLRWNIFGNRFG